MAPLPLSRKKALACKFCKASVADPFQSADVEGKVKTYSVIQAFRSKEQRDKTRDYVPILSPFDKTKLSPERKDLVQGIRVVIESVSLGFSRRTPTTSSSTSALPPPVATDAQGRKFISDFSFGGSSPTNAALVFMFPVSPRAPSLWIPSTTLSGWLLAQEGDHVPLGDKAREWMKEEADEVRQQTKGSTTGGMKDSDIVSRLISLSTPLFLLIPHFIGRGFYSFTFILSVNSCTQRVSLCKASSRNAPMRSTATKSTSGWSRASTCTRFILSPSPKGAVPPSLCLLSSSQFSITTASLT
ncbi:hypothetical protein NMY22_g14001 [Coprinellus aureogranulatus]|nr:hypothetical protein NMY22_g14001 [Coprinellus aureogranulatus]